MISGVVQDVDILSFSSVSTRAMKGQCLHRSKHRNRTLAFQEVHCIMFVQLIGSSEVIKSEVRQQVEISPRFDRMGHYWVGFCRGKPQLPKDADRSVLEERSCLQRFFHLSTFESRTHSKAGLEPTARGFTSRCGVRSILPRSSWRRRRPIIRLIWLWKKGSPRRPKCNFGSTIPMFQKSQKIGSFVQS
ncbi:(Dimethylallyl)adenosine tRNAmethylthiotransferase MiaB [Striga asiatica]|uniref:(Dimethylallyl)adenosine tRNAmethylthiotransferase MiaB n=1 Tax=Striga asiatica TaxID=4170 RepID=A0A5A7Q067_STRAF|nr:(Dimethylallyl)adenosine tRNAmethylthiotransferase MiaB [Striga asiatica]